jgi:hypothetical protein
MTQLRQKMLEELQRRNYSDRTAKTAVATLQVIEIETKQIGRTMNESQCGHVHAGTDYGNRAAIISTSAGPAIAA